MVDRERARDAGQRLELTRLSALAEVQWLRRSLEDVQRLCLATQKSTGDDRPALFLAVYDRLAEALRNSREIETFLRDAEKTTRELQALLNVPDADG